MGSVYTWSPFLAVSYLSLRYFDVCASTLLTLHTGVTDVRGVFELLCAAVSPVVSYRIGDVSASDIVCGSLGAVHVHSFPEALSAALFPDATDAYPLFMNGSWVVDTLGRRQDSGSEADPSFRPCLPDTWTTLVAEPSHKKNLRDEPPRVLAPPARDPKRSNRNHQGPRSQSDVQPPGRQPMPRVFLLDQPPTVSVFLNAVRDQLAPASHGRPP